jgi:hypothetical protein
VFLEDLCEDFLLLKSNLQLGSGKRLIISEGSFESLNVSLVLQKTLCLFWSFAPTLGNICSLLIHYLERHIVRKLGQVDFLGDHALMIEMLRWDLLC